MRELLVATKNKGKLREIKDLLKDFDLNITSLADYPDCPRIVEDGRTFRTNAVKKAQTIARYTGKLVMGEDSGLEVEALGGAPGVYSARFAGEAATDEDNNAKLLKALKGVPDLERGARYRCFAVLADRDKTVKVVSGSCRGRIAHEAVGINGFGYDPLFYLPRYQKTFGQLDPAIKSRISHRARALARLKKFFEEISPAKK